MEEQTNEETPQAEEDSMLEEEEQQQEEEEEEEAEEEKDKGEEGEMEEVEEEELTDAEIVELEGGTDDEEQIDVAVNVELGDDTLTTADAAQGTDDLFTADVDATEEEIGLGLTDVDGPEEPPVGKHDSIVDDDEMYVRMYEMDLPATIMSVDHFDVLEQPLIATVSADLGEEDTVALPEDGPSQPDTLSPDTRLGLYTHADYEEEEEEVEGVDELAEYADADQTAELEEKAEERPSGTEDVPGV